MVKRTVFFLVFLVYFFRHTSDDKNWPQNGINYLAHLNAKFSTHIKSKKKKREKYLCPTFNEPHDRHCTRGCSANGAEGERKMNISRILEAKFVYTTNVVQV
jgi:hypothetical protein